jgi:hypothetical protein
MEPHGDRSALLRALLRHARERTAAAGGVVVGGARRDGDGKREDGAPPTPEARSPFVPASDRALARLASFASVSGDGAKRGRARKHGRAPDVKRLAIILLWAQDVRVLIALWNARAL